MNHARTPTPPARRGFTMLEMVLATVIAAVVLLAVGGIFGAVAVSDRASEAALARSSEFAMTQGAARRTFLRLVVAANREVAEDEVLPRPRLALGPDPAARGAPRFEVVVSRPPVSGALATSAAEWAFASQDDASLNFVSSDGSGGQERGVFELRPDGSRERVMTRLGLESPWWDAPSDVEVDARGMEIHPAAFTGAKGTPVDTREGTTWTLWYRRMTAEEIAILDMGSDPWPDGFQDDEIEVRRLAGAVRLATGLTEARWRVFKGDEWVTDYTALMVQDLPAFIQLRARAENGTFAEWLFEIGWTESERVGTDDAAASYTGSTAGDTAAAGTDTPGDPGDPADPATNPDPGTGPTGDNGPTLPTGDGDSSSGGTSIRLYNGSNQ